MSQMSFQKEIVATMFRPCCLVVLWSLFLFVGLSTTQTVCNCPNITSLTDRCPSTYMYYSWPVTVKTFGDRCSCSRLWCRRRYVQQTECLPGWNVTEINSYTKICSKKLKGLYTWQTGKQKCGAAFMAWALRRYDGANIMREVMDSGDFWTGGHLDGESGKFYLDGIPLWNMDSINSPVYQWSPKPFPKKGDCVSAKLDRQTALNVSTRPCGDQLQVICQSEGFSQKLNEVSKCGSGWYGAPHLDVCYKYHVKQRSFSDAEEHCQQQGGHLAMPSDLFILSHVRQATPNDPQRFNGSVADKTFIGLFYEDGTFKWSNKSTVHSSFDVDKHFTANRTTLQKYCYVMLNQDLLVNQKYGYRKVLCSESHPFLCQKRADNPSPVTILKPPVDTVIYRISDLRPQKREIESGNAMYSVKCVPGGDYFALTSRVNGFPTQSAQSGHNGRVEGDAFGILTCEAWSYSPFAKVSSQPVLVRRFGERYFVGWFLMPNARFEESHVLYNWFDGNKARPQEEQEAEGIIRSITNQALIKAYPRMVSFFRDTVTLFDNTTLGLGVHFNFTLRLNLLHEPADLSGLLDTLQSAMWSYGGQSIDTQTIRLLSAEYCYPKMMTVDGQIMTFPTSYAGTVASEQICGTTGQPLGLLKCVGNFTTGLSWVGSPQVIPCDEQESAVTDRLRILSQVAINFSNVESVTKEAADLTSNATELNSADIVYVSIIIDHVSRLTSISQKVTKYVLLTYNNVMDSDTLVVGSSQRVYNASSRLTKVLEYVSSKIPLGDNSSFVEVLPNVALAIFDQGVNTTALIRGVQLVSSRHGNGMNETLVQPLFNARANRDIDSSDITIALPASAVEPKGILHLFNETKNSRIVFSRKLFSVDASKVSSREDCASLCAGKRFDVCASFNFHEVSKACELFNSFSQYANLEPLDGWSANVYVPEWEAGQKISFILYNNWKLFQTPYQLYGSSSGDKQWLTYSKIVSAKINTRSVKVVLEEPLEATFLPLKRHKFRNASIVCGYWDYDIGDFSQEGCWSNGTVNGRHVCLCDHLTNFAVLLDVHGTTIDDSHKLALSIISIIGLSLSIVGLLCTIITFLAFRKLRKGRSQQTLFNLSLALLLSMIVFLAGVEQTTIREGCITVAVLLHYLILVSFAWMLIEGILQYLRFVKVLGTYIPRFMLKACLLAWGIPLLFVVIPVAVNPDLYGGKEYCWLSRDLFYYGFMIPVCAAIVVNAVFFVLVVRALTCARATHLQSNQDERKVAILHLYAGISTLLLLGITWVFGFLAINEARLVFQYIFCICNSLQGFFIFIFFNVREKKVRDAWRDLLCKTRQKHGLYSEKSDTSNPHVSRTVEELKKENNSNHSTGNMYVVNPEFKDK